MSTSELVEFLPYHAEGWRDSTEGGQFVMLAVPKPEEWPQFCHIDVSILLTSPDVCQTPNDLWQPYDHQANMAEHELYRYLSIRSSDTRGVLQDVKELPPWAKEFSQGFRYREWANWAARAWGWDRMSASCLAAVHLGSSSWSMWNESQGRYWTASLDDLTERGKNVYDSLYAAFEIEPLLLTFLDT